MSPTWIEEFNSAMSGVVVPGPGPDAGLAAVGGRFKVAQEVHGTPDGDIRVILEVEDGTLHMSLASPGTGDSAGDGPVDEAAEVDVTIALSYKDAAAMSKGELDPAEALNTGRIRVRGDLSVLVTGYEMLIAAKEGTHALSESTTY